MSNKRPSDSVLGKIAVGGTLTAAVLAALHRFLSVIFLILTPLACVVTFYGYQIWAIVSVFILAMLFPVEGVEGILFVVAAFLGALMVVIPIVLVVLPWLWWGIIPIYISALAVAVSVIAIVYGISALSKNKRSRGARFSLVAGIVTLILNFVGFIWSVFSFSGSIAMVIIVASVALTMLLS